MGPPHQDPDDDALPKASTGSPGGGGGADATSSGLSIDLTRPSRGPADDPTSAPPPISRTVSANSRQVNELPSARPFALTEAGVVVVRRGLISQVTPGDIQLTLDSKPTASGSIPPADQVPEGAAKRPGRKMRFRRSYRLAVAAALAAVSLWMTVDGLGNQFPDGRVDTSLVASSRTGSLTLRFLDVPKGFAASAKFSLFDSRYVRPGDSTEPLLSATVVQVTDRSDLGLLRMEVEATIPAAASNDRPLIWILTSSGSGQLGMLANVRDNGKIVKTSCGAGLYLSSRVPDNAQRLSGRGPDPAALAIGHMNEHPPALDVDGMLSGTPVPLPNFAGSADEATFSNATVIGPTTVYAGVLCPGIASVPARETKAPKCKATPTDVGTLPAGPEEAAIAQAFGQPPPQYTMTTCATITEIRLAGSDGRLHVGSYFQRPQMVNSSTGEFAAQLPSVRALATFKNGTEQQLPVQVAAYSSELNGVRAEVAPRRAFVTGSRASYLTNTQPDPLPACPPRPACADGATRLEWSSPTGDPLAVRLSGINPELANRYEHDREAGIVRWSVGLALLIPLLGSILQMLARRHT